MKAVSLLQVIVAMALAGCSSMSGLDAKDTFSCKAPDGVLCESMTGIYANAQQNNLPGQRVTGRGPVDIAPFDKSSMHRPDGDNMFAAIASAPVKTLAEKVGSCLRLQNLALRCLKPMALKRLVAQRLGAQEVTPSVPEGSASWRRKLDEPGVALCIQNRKLRLLAAR